MESSNYNKWKENNPSYSKAWYESNKEKIRAKARQKYKESVIDKRMEEASANLIEDEWKPIPDFENYRINIKGVVVNKFGKELKPSKIPSTGHLHVALSNKDVKGKHFYIHQLVWITFKGEIPIGLNVCHSDGNAENNDLTNLCLMTQKENLNKLETVERFRKSQLNNPRKNCGRKRKTVYQYDMEGNLIKEWEGAKSTEEGGFSSSCVSLCCLGKYKQHKGYVWSYLLNITN